ncbi:hypothetical protein NLU03_28520 [Bacillus toyonensis]|nr:hypothetical protein [Bacillus toyonensis]
MNHNLYNELFSLGVKTSHLEKMKNEKPTEHEIQMNYHTYVKTDEIPISINLRKLKGLSRGDTRFTWWDHLTLEARQLNYHKRDRLLNILKNDGLDKFIHSFEQNEYAIDVIYLDDEDAYYTCEGNHRTVLAKILNVPFIKAKVSYHTCDIPCKNAFNQYQNNRHKLELRLESLGLKLNFPKDVTKTPLEKITEVGEGSILYNEIEILSTNIPSLDAIIHNWDDSRSTCEKFISTQNEFRYLNQQLDLLEKTDQLYRPFSPKWKIRFLKFFLVFLDDNDDNLHKKDSYKAMITLYEQNYSQPNLVSNKP